MVDRILITGGCGFIGSAFVRQQVAMDRDVVVIDSLTYAGDVRRIPKVPFYRADIADKKSLEKIFRKDKPSVIIHFAAETHVDRSLKDLAPFIRSNIQGTQNLIELSLKYKVKRFVYVSTDEVYGEARRGTFKERDPLKACNPYSATKAAGEFLIQAAIKAFDFPAIIVRPTNTYGPHQYPEKLIPVVITRASRNKKIPVYGRGRQRREWLYVDDCAAAIDVVARKGKTNEIYNIGSGVESSNLDLVKKILKRMKKPQSLISFVTDRPGHDFRYALDSAKVRKLGWKPKMSLDEGLQKTIEFYI